VRVLAVNAGSTGLKLHLVEGDEATAVDGLVAADAVGHRVVHGGERFRQPVLVDDDVERAIDELSALAPLHNVPALLAIRDARRVLSDVPHVAVFDTAFHATIPPRASTYAVPERWRTEWGVRRYGFHGLSVEWAATQVRVPRLVVCHLGGGCSITAVRDGRSIDTTMGFSPLEGVPMATRSGSVDPGALLYVLRERGLSLDQLDHALEHESGLLALGGSTDPRDLAGTQALDVYAYRIASAVGAMAVALGGIDALAFTGGVGEGSEDVRGRIVGQLEFLDGFQVVVVPAREELVIASAVRRVLAS
jgi:acetate kinase